MKFEDKNKGLPVGAHVNFLLFIFFVLILTMFNDGRAFCVQLSRLPFSHSRKWPHAGDVKHVRCRNEKSHSSPPPCTEKVNF